jgi:hypothetical protein
MEQCNAKHTLNTHSTHAKHTNTLNAYLSAQQPRRDEAAEEEVDGVLLARILKAVLVVPHPVCVFFFFFCAKRRFQSAICERERGR